MNLTLKVWRQPKQGAAGHFEEYQVRDANENASLLEVIDVVNDDLTKEGRDPIAFDHDCREGICGTCSMMVNGDPHGPAEKVTTCQTYVRSFRDGQTIVLEPFRAKAFPILKDLVTDRSAFDRIISRGGFISVNTGQAPDANALPVPKDVSELAFDAAHCIGCGACVAACKNASAMLFVSAKITHLGVLPQGQPERYRRVVAMVEQMDKEGFGACTNTGACEAVCPKGISTNFISRLNLDYVVAGLKEGVAAPKAAVGEGA